MILAILSYAAALVTTYLLLLLGYRLLLHPLAPYPGPLLSRLTDAYGAYHALSGRHHLATRANLARYGPVYRHGPDRLVFSSPRAFHDIYESDRVVKSDVYLATLGYTGTINVFSAIHKSVHRPRRQMAGAALTDRAMRKFEPTMLTEIAVFLRQLLESTSERTSVNLSEGCRRLGIDVSTRLAFGYPLATQTQARNRFLQQGITAANAHNNVLLQWPFLNSHLFAAPLHVLTTGPRNEAMGFVQGMIEERLRRREEGKGEDEDEDGDDYFAQIVDQLPRETDLRKSDLWSEALFMIPAAGDTAGSTLTALFFYLSRSETAYARLAAEIRTIFPSAAAIVLGPTLSGCRYLRACIDETLRLSPPVLGALWRQQSPDDKQPLIIDGHVIPRGTHFAASIYTLHHDEAYFPDAETYNPERWLDEDMDEDAKRNMNYAFVPFSLGYRGCAGKTMAYMEVGLTIARTLWYFDFETAFGEEGKLGEGGMPDAEEGREKASEFQMRDAFTATHEGPSLVFRTRDDHWRELK